jgi:hypothetical protein
VILPAQLHSEGHKVYWSDRGGGLHRVDADGSNRISIPAPEPDTRGLAVHGPRRELYVSSSFNIYRMSLDGENPVRVATRAGSYLAVDPVNDKLYWSTGRQIVRANVDGSGVETIMASEQGPLGFFGIISELGVDGTHDSLYWLENGRPFRSTLDGENREPLFGMANLELPLTGIAASSDGTVCTSFSSIAPPVYISGNIDCRRYDGQFLFQVTPPRQNWFDPPFLPEHVTLGAGAEPYWHNAWMGGDGAAIEGKGPLTSDVVFTNRVIAPFNDFIYGMAVDDFVIPEPSTAVLTLAAATLAFLAVRCRRQRT